MKILIIKPKHRYTVRYNTVSTTVQRDNEEEWLGIKCKGMSEDQIAGFIYDYIEYSELRS